MSKGGKDTQKKNYNELLAKEKKLDELGRGKASNRENTTLFLKNYLFHALEIHLQCILHLSIS